MPRLTKAEIDQKLLQGMGLPWFDGAKSATLQLTTSAQRRLFKFLSESGTRSVKGLSDTFVKGLHGAFVATEDPATGGVAAASGSATAGPWYLRTIHTEGFGGVNTWNGKAFAQEVPRDGMQLDGPNGSGKSSLTGAIIWCLTGDRPRDTGVNLEATARQDVFNASGTRVGDWPPIACYPTDSSSLATKPSVLVTLTFENDSGVSATVQRSIINGVMSDVWDPALQLPAALIETGIVMPTRLGKLRLGTDQQQLKDAVQMLTGLDETIALGDFAAELCHGSYEYLGYAKKQRRQDLETSFNESKAIVAAQLAAIGQPSFNFSPVDTQDPKSLFATKKTELENAAKDSLQVIADDLSPKVAASIQENRKQIVTHVEVAKAEIGKGLAGVKTWETLRELASGLSSAKLLELQGALDGAAEEMRLARRAKERADKDSRFRLKVLAAQWHATHSSGPISACPLCEQNLVLGTGLSVELDELKAAGEQAARSYRDTMNSIASELRRVVPPEVQKHLNVVLALEPKVALVSELESQFVQSPKYKDWLVGLSKLSDDALKMAPSADLPKGPEPDAAGMPDGSLDVVRLMAQVERAAQLGRWVSANSNIWATWWGKLAGPPSGDPLDGTLLKKIASLEEAIRASAPYSAASIALNSAWDTAVKIVGIDREQQKRDAVAKELAALKDLRKFAEAETRSAIQGLSSKMSTTLEDIYLPEKLKFGSAHVDKKAGVSIRGSLDGGFHIDAALVANTSWMRALLWAFLFAVRKEAVEQLGEDRLPLLVLDDPQSTFDLTHRARWASQVVGFQSTSPNMQVILASHDESFLAQMQTAKAKGSRGYLVAPGIDSDCIQIIDGDRVQRAWKTAEALKTPEVSVDYIARARIHVEALLKIMLRGEADTRPMTLGKLRDLIRNLNNTGVTPFTRNCFKELATALDNSKPEIQHLESSHHSTGSTFGFADAVTVNKYWTKPLLPLLEKSFRVVREYRLLHGESKALHAAESTVVMPAGYSDVAKAIPIELIGRAAALSGSHSDGSIAFEQYDASKRIGIVLNNHSFFRLGVSTLEPVARAGDFLIVANVGGTPDGSLVVAECGDTLLARRFMMSPDHPDVAVLTAQSIRPSQIAPPQIAHRSTVVLRKIVGVIFDPAGFPGKLLPGHEVTDCGGSATITSAISSSVGLAEVAGHSAEPQALNKQYLFVGKSVSPDLAVKTLNGRPVIASDTNGNYYFKRMRAVGKSVVLESLHAGGEYAPILLSTDSGAGVALANVLPVLGVLFERP